MIPKAQYVIRIFLFFSLSFYMIACSDSLDINYAIATNIILLNLKSQYYLDYIDGFFVGPNSKLLGIVYHDRGVSYEFYNLESGAFVGEYVNENGSYNTPSIIFSQDGNTAFFVHENELKALKVNGEKLFSR